MCIDSMFIDSMFIYLSNTFDNSFILGQVSTYVQSMSLQSNGQSTLRRQCRQIHSCGKAVNRLREDGVFLPQKNSNHCCMLRLNQWKQAFIDWCSVVWWSGEEQLATPILHAVPQVTHSMLPIDICQKGIVANDPFTWVLRVYSGVRTYPQCRS